MADWQISKPLGKCSGSGIEINPLEEYYGALVETENGIERRDFSCEFWQKNQPQVYCYWKTQMPSPDQKKQIFIDDDIILSFFSRLQNETEQDKIDFRFVLCLVLMRKRILKYQNSKYENGLEIWQLKNMTDKEYVDVINPHLDEAKIDQLRQQMGQILQGDLD